MRVAASAAADAAAEPSAAAALPAEHQAFARADRCWRCERTQRCARRSPVGAAMTDFLAYIGLATQTTLIITVVLFTVSGFDDLVIDVYYVCRQLFMLLYVRRRWPRLKEEQLLGAVE